MIEPGWIGFYTAARELQKRNGGSLADAQRKLRQACEDGRIRSMKAPYDGEGERSSIFPIVFWVRVAPSEWREREVDYDGPDKDGCQIEVMLSEDDVQHWLDQPAEQKANQRGKVPRIIVVLQKMYFPERVPEPGLCVRKELIDKLAKGDPPINVTDKTLKKAIDQYNASIGIDRK
jgi:hypothetical protein